MEGTLSRKVGTIDVWFCSFPHICNRRITVDQVCPFRPLHLTPVLLLQSPHKAPLLSISP